MLLALVWSEQTVVVVPDHLPFSNCPDGKQNNQSIIIRNCWRLYHDFLRWRVKHQKRVHLHAVETTPSHVKLFKLRAFRHFPCSFTSIYTWPRKFIICTGNVGTGKSPGEPLRHLFESSLNIGFTDTFVASTTLLIPVLLESILKTCLACISSSDRGVPWKRAEFY